MQTKQQNTFKIDIPDGCLIDSFDKSTGQGTYKEKAKRERLNTDEAVLTDNGYTWESFEKWCEGLRPHERATRFIELLQKSLNGDVALDFDNSDQVKYEPRFVGGSSGFRYYVYDVWYSYSHVGSRLCFLEPDDAIHAGQTFTKWYKTIIVQ